MAQPKIRNVIIKNTSDKMLWCQVQSQKSAVTSESYEALRHAINKSSGSDSMSTSVSVSGKTGVEFAASTSYSKSSSHANENNNKHMDKRGAQYSVSDFIADGWNPIDPGDTRKFAVQGHMWYISGIDGDGNPLAKNWNTNGIKFVFNGKRLNEIDTAKQTKVKQKKKEKVKVAKFDWGASFGGGGGSYFNAPSNKQIKGIRIRSGGYVDAIQVLIKGSNWTQWFGGGGGGLSEYICDNDEYFNKVIIKSGGYVDYVEFRTNKSNYVRGGGNGGKRHEESEGILCGVRGKSGGYVDQLQFEWNSYE